MREYYHVSTPESRELAAKYTLEHCAELLDADPKGAERLFDMAHARPVVRLYDNARRRKARQPALA